MIPRWAAYLSVLACSFGVRDEGAAYPMSTFRPTDTLEEAERLAAEMNAAGYLGDALNYRAVVLTGEREP